MLTGEDIEERHDDEIDDCLDPASSPIATTATPLELLPDYFDIIIIDESNRSIYSNWGKVHRYFDTARLIGLTVTPSPRHARPKKAARSSSVSRLPRSSAARGAAASPPKSRNASTEPWS